MSERPDPYHQLLPLADHLRPSMILGVLFLVAAVVVIPMRASSLASAKSVDRLVALAEWPNSSELMMIGLLLIVVARLGIIADRLAQRPPGE
jgi:hypothetical protein